MNSGALADNSWFRFNAAALCWADQHQRMLVSFFYVYIKYNTGMYVQIQLFFEVNLVVEIYTKKNTEEKTENMSKKIV